MITLIFGIPGSGKTSYSASCVCDYMTNRDYFFQDITNCKAFTKKLNSYGWNFHSPTDHLVFADFDVKSVGFGLLRRKSYWVDGFYLGLPNPKHPTILLPPYAHIFLDESQKYFNSRMSAKFEDFVSRFYEQHRHMHYDIYLSCQRAKLIDLNIREIVGKFIEVKEMDIEKDNFGDVKKITWRINEFNSCANVEKYLTDNDKQWIDNQTTKTIDYDIFRMYDSHFFLPLFFNGRKPKTSDYFLYRTPDLDLSADGINKFNLLHDYKTPKTYYK